MLFNLMRAYLRYPEGDEATGGSPTPNNEEKVEKIVAKRLAQEKVKALAQAREDVAKENGFTNYDEFVKAQREAKIKKETNYDPEDEDFDKLVKIVKGEKDPEKEELVVKLKTYEEAEAIKWETEQLKQLKELYDVKVESLSELDEKVQTYIKKGVDPVDAYYLVHKPTGKKNNEPDDKKHLTPDPKNGATDSKDKLTPQELATFKVMLPDLSEEEIIEKVKKLRETSK